MNASRRKRIVIDLVQQPQGVKSSKRGAPWSRMLALLAIGLAGILLVAGVTGYLWWRHYKTTPAYSLALIIDAAQRSDMETFNRLINSEKVVDSLASQAADKLTSRIGIPGSVLSSHLQIVSPLLPARLKTTFRDWLADEIKQFSSTFGTKPFLIIALTLPAVVKITSDENTARIEAALRGQPVELTMQRDGEIWKLVGLKDDALLTRVLDEVSKDLPAVAPLDAIEPGSKVRRKRR